VRSFALSITRCREQSAKNTTRKSLSCTVPSRDASLVHWHDILGGGWHCLHGLEDEQGSKQQPLADLVPWLANEVATGQWEMAAV
jgi:uncharacterized protein YigE (DUF2233 family)